MTSRPRRGQSIAIWLRAVFGAGVKLVWYVDPRKRTVEVFINPEPRFVLAENDTLSGDDVLPGFSVSLADFFADPLERGESSTPA